jgi:hypothetical protein
MENFAFDDGAHGFNRGQVNQPHSALFGAAQAEDYTLSGLPYTFTNAVATDIDCTTCHNVHNNNFPPFSMKGAAINGLDFSPLCKSCHAGRANPGSVGAANSFAIGGTSYSTHPTDVGVTDIPDNKDTRFVAVDSRMSRTTTVAAWNLGGKRVDGLAGGNISCQTCHAVHGDESSGGHYDDLLAIPNVATHATAAATTLCTGCHGNPYGGAVNTVGTGTDHPSDGNTGKTFYPTGAWASGSGVPAAWTGAAHFDSGATPFTPASNQTPACSSCHDSHGGVAGSSLLYGPNTVAGSGDWCFNCHPASIVQPAAHHSNTGNDDDGVTFTSALGCGDCHGGAVGASWQSHNGFTTFRVAVAEGNSNLCTACHTATAPKTLLGGYLQANWPSTHGIDRGNASHYLGTDSNEFAGVTPKIDAWTSSAYFSEYGGQTGGGLNPPAAAGAIICESCHNLLYNDGRRNPGSYASALRAGWESNLLLQPYVDDGAGLKDGTGASAVRDALCTGCHTASAGAYHHPVGSGTILATKADAAGAPNQASFPNATSMDCDSCHRPHDADDDSTVAAGTHGHVTDANPTYHLLEVDGANHDWSTLCDQCHAKK